MCVCVQGIRWVRDMGRVQGIYVEGVGVFYQRLLPWPNQRAHAKNSQHLKQYHIFMSCRQGNPGRAARESISSSSSERERGRLRSLSHSLRWYLCCPLLGLRVRLSLNFMFSILYSYFFFAFVFVLFFVLKKEKQLKTLVICVCILVCNSLLQHLLRI